MLFKKEYLVNQKFKIDIDFSDEFKVNKCKIQINSILILKLCFLK